MAKREELLQEFVNRLSGVLGQDLVSAVLYGSAADGENHTDRSDHNVMIVAKKISLDAISSLEKTLDWGRRQGKINPVFWTEEELKRSADVFPVEFLEMQARHQVLYGADLLQGIKLDTANLRHQIEFEMRGKVLRLRSEWLRFKDSPKAGMDFLARAGTAFMALFRQVQNIPNIKLDASVAEPFRMCLLLKKGEIKQGKGDLVKLYREVHDAAENVIQLIDSI